MEVGWRPRRGEARGCGRENQRRCAPCPQVYPATLATNALRAYEAPDDPRVAPPNENRRVLELAGIRMVRSITENYARGMTVGSVFRVWSVCLCLCRVRVCGWELGGMTNLITRQFSPTRDRAVDGGPGEGQPPIADASRMCVPMPARWQEVWPRHEN